MACLTVFVAVRVVRAWVRAIVLQVKRPLFLHPRRFDSSWRAAPNSVVSVVLMPHQPSESLKKLCHDGNPLGMFWDELPGAPASAHTVADPNRG